MLCVVVIIVVVIIPTIGWKKPCKNGLLVPFYRPTVAIVAVTFNTVDDLVFF